MPTYMRLQGDFRFGYDGTLVTTVVQARLQTLLAYLLFQRASPQSIYNLSSFAGLLPQNLKHDTRTFWAPGNGVSLGSTAYADSILWLYRLLQASIPPKTEEPILSFGFGFKVRMGNPL